MKYFLLIATTFLILLLFVPVPPTKSSADWINVSTKFINGHNYIIFRYEGASISVVHDEGCISQKHK